MGCEVMSSDRSVYPGQPAGNAHRDLPWRPCCSSGPVEQLQNGDRLNLGVS